MGDKQNWAPGTHWRDSARAARFLLVDYRACFALLLWMFHIRLSTFIFAVSVMGFLAVLEHHGFTVQVFARLLRSKLSGATRSARPWFLRERRY